MESRGRRSGVQPCRKGPGGKAYAEIYFPAALDLGKASTVTVKEGEEIPAVDILMKEVVAYRIRGKVTNLLSKTRGGQNVQIAVLRRDSGGWNEVGSTSVEKADDTFEIPAVAPGEYSLLAFSFDDGKAHSTQGDLTVGNADVEGLTVIIGPGVNIPGRVAWEGKPSLERAGLTVGAAPPGPVYVWANSVDVSNE